ncbi:MAG: hypothetical protein PWP52_1341 [Bacteroidales bacterium]|jgi:uncharacterized membrane protein YsdA (DUF1294 family)|nr:hypothetical protein [Bacteroidales bacterium]
MLYVKLLLFAIAITAIIMVIYAIKRKQNDNTDFRIETDPEKYKKMKEEGIYNAYKQENEK